MPKNVLSIVISNPPYCTIQQFIKRPTVDEVELAYAQHVVVQIFTNILGAAAKESIYSNTETKTTIAYTMGKDRPQDSPFAVDNGFNQPLSIGRRKQVIHELAMELSLITECDSNNLGGSIKFDHSLTTGTGHGQDWYILERVGKATEKVYKYRCAPE